MKVKSLASELGKKPKEFIKLLQELDINVKSENTKLDESIVDTIRDLLKGTPSSSENDDSPVKKEIILSNNQIKLSELAKLLNVPLKDIMKIIMDKGLLLNLNSIIDYSFAKDIANDLNITLQMTQATEKSVPEKKPALSESKDIKQLKSRSPIVTVMGHVDHGKTSLLDKIRSKNVVDTEAGGITQHIGAYQVRLKNKKKMTFLDTPGHEAFTSLRSRGSKITDIAILVIAANDGIKPQTIEAINHAKAANLPIIVALNKIDIPGINIETIKQQLVEHDLVPEDWGGKTIVCPISVKTNEGIDALLDMISLSADLLELKTTYDGLGKAIIIESFLDKKRGPICTALVQSGVVSIGNHMAVGNIYGKARALYDDNKDQIKKALPSTPIEILGMSAVPNPGDTLDCFNTESDAKAAVEMFENNNTNVNKNVINTVSLDTLSKQIISGTVKKLNLIIKADVHGSLDAILMSIQQINSEDVSINVLHSGTGGVNENDVLLAKASEGVILGFRVPITGDAKNISEKNKIEIKLYQIIYEILDDIKNIMSGMVHEIINEVKIGSAEVREIFKFSKIGTIAGSYVNSGKLIRNNKIKIIRKDKEIFDGKLTSLKRFKDDTKQVENGYECGISVDNFSQFEQGDIIDCYGVEDQ